MLKFNELMTLKTGTATYIVQIRGFRVSDGHTLKDLNDQGNKYGVLLADFVYVGSKYGKVDKLKFQVAACGTGCGGFRVDELVSLTPLKRGVKMYRKMFEAEALTKQSV